MYKKSEAGTSLVEVLVTVVVIGTAFSALLSGLATAITTSDTHKKQSNDEVVLRSLADYITRVDSRIVTSVTLNKSVNISFASGAITSSDIGKSISGTGLVPGAVIVTVPTATTATISIAATINGSSDEGIHAYSDCINAATATTRYLSNQPTLPTGYSTTITTVEYFDRSASPPQFKNSLTICSGSPASDYGIQRLTIQVTDPGGGTQSLQAIKRRS